MNSGWLDIIVKADVCEDTVPEDKEYLALVYGIHWIPVSFTLGENRSN